MFLPRALSAISDAQSAIQRLAKVFAADVMVENTLVIDPELDVALRAEDATFEWEESAPPDQRTGKGGKKGKKGKDLKRAMEEQKDKKTEQSAPFRVRDVNLTIPRGQLVAIVGPVGSGKVVYFYLQGMIILRLYPVELAPRPHWRDAQSARQRGLWRTNRLLPPNGLDPECNTCMCNRLSSRKT